jgi:predicted regulator of Ras-like GTPase activity (Roadblock/LC7/MglB family)
MSNEKLHTEETANSDLGAVSGSVYAFDVNKECYCSLCERHYKNYKRFVIHMKKAKHYC